MKKLLILVIFLITFSLGAQTYEHDGDVWHLDTTIDSTTKTMYCELDMQQSEWEGINPRLWGIHSVVFTLVQHKEGPLTIVISYMTDIIEYTLPHYILLSNDDYDFQMYGGQRTHGDRSLYREDNSRNVAFNIIYLSLFEDKKKQFLSIKEDKLLWVDEMQYDYGIVYGLPKEIISEFNTFIKETEYEKEIVPNPDIDAPKLQSIG